LRIYQKCNFVILPEFVKSLPHKAQPCLACVDATQAFSGWGLSPWAEFTKPHSHNVSSLGIHLHLCILFKGDMKKIVNRYTEVLIPAS